MAIFNPVNEISAEMLLKNFLREVYLDDDLALGIAKKLAERPFPERNRLIQALGNSTGIHRKRWDTLVSNIK